MRHLLPLVALAFLLACAPPPIVPPTVAQTPTVPQSLPVPTPQVVFPTATATIAAPATTAPPTAPPGRGTGAVGQPGPPSTFPPTLAPNITATPHAAQLRAVLQRDLVAYRNLYLQYAPPSGTAERDKDWRAMDGALVGFWPGRAEFAAYYGWVQRNYRYPFFESTSRDPAFLAQAQIIDAYLNR